MLLIWDYAVGGMQKPCTPHQEAMLPHLGRSCRGSSLGVTSFLTGHSPAPGQLRVLIEQRSGAVRNMLQLEELLSQCNQPQPPDSGLNLSCRQFTFTGDLKRWQPITGSTFIKPAP